MDVQWRNITAPGIQSDASGRTRSPFTRAPGRVERAEVGVPVVIAQQQGFKRGDIQLGGFRPALSGTGL